MNRRRKFLFASVLALQNSSFIYPSCQRCFSRIFLESKRFTCPKCGCTGDAESANYRYRLSLKVAESNTLFVITVFGSCLDTYFGLTATGLHRYLKDSSKIPETLDSGRTQSLLTTAVEKCFVGQSFVFGVTNFGDVCGHHSNCSNFQQPCCKHRGEVRTLVASQIVLPDPRVTGFTVIDYLHPLLHRKHHCDSQDHSSQSLTSDHSDSEFNSIQGSGNTSWVLESSREDFFRFWQPSLELTSTDSHITSNDDFPPSEQLVASGTPTQNGHCVSFSEVTSSNNCHDSLQSLWSFVSCMDKNNTTGKLGEELGLLSPICSSCHESRLTDSNFFPSQMQKPFKEHNLECYSKAEKNDYSQYDIPCYQHREVNTTILQQGSSAFSLSSLKPEETASASQKSDSLIWDDIPFSESLNKFLAVVESEIAVAEIDTQNRKQGTDNSTDKCHKNYSRLSLTPLRDTRALNTPPFGLRSSQAMRENSRREAFFYNSKSSSSSQIQRESHPDKAAAAVSIGSNRSDISKDFLPDTCSSALFTSSDDMEASISQKRTSGVLQQRNEISCRLRTSISDCSDLSNSCFTGCEEKSHSGTKEKLAIQNCSKKYNDVSDLHKLENKRSYRWPEKQDDNFTISRKLTYPLETFRGSPKSISKEKPYRPSNNNLTQSSSADHEGSYNASADLFDDFAKDKDTETEITKLPQDILLPLEASCTENYPINENCNHPSQKLSLQSISPSEYQRPSSQSDSECDFEESQEDFVPCSQSTPVAGFHQRIHGLNGASKILPSFYSHLNANYKNTNISPLTGKCQATPTCPKNVKTSTQKLNHCPAAECLENDMDEWVPPTTKKVFISDVCGLRVTCLRKCLAVHYSPDQKELPRKKLIKVTHKTNK
ncbi:DNA damage-induced apoptosis suppressor protein [Rattus norvegicus]|uniref:DNA damage-induced apoptosis suppressor protein n=2 Tax=Rattus norvegicus TaxID=10116 RepID=B2GV00_RAT|nr:DNA damage-induced apoptosis suppressor protein [Rattus norvegicus]AAI66470.1 RGD1559690 protein [Rattus norvegicus]|eukprot:NP_001119766.1 DNA damage-induced apoptosis suppressor protein [Rattus norvegicus]